MAILTDVIGRIYLPQAGNLRGWFVRVVSERSPTPEDIADAIEEQIESVLGSSDSPSLKKFLANNLPQLTFEILGVYRDR